MLLSCEPVSLSGRLAQHILMENFISNLQVLVRTPWIFMALMRLELVNKHAENSVPEAADWVLRNLRILHHHLTLLGSSSQ